MSDFDVLIIGGFALKEKSGGNDDTRSKMTLRLGNSPATIEVLRTLVQTGGDIAKTSGILSKASGARFIGRSLNSIYLYDFLSKNGISAEVVNYFALEQDRFMTLMACRPKTVIISTTFMPDVADIIAIAKAVKELCPKTIVIAGGIKVLKSFKSLMLYRQGYFDGFDRSRMMREDFFFDKEIDSNIDIFVIEECGELALLDLLRNIKNGTPWKKVPNIVYRRNGELLFGDRRQEPFTFDRNPISWERIPPDIIGNEIPIKAGMGCPYRCAFCDFSGLHKVRMRATSSILEDIARAQSTFPGKPVFFTDDNLFATKRRTIDLTKAIIHSGLRFKWRAFFRVDGITEETAPLLAQSGCSGSLLGVESGDPGILLKMNKKATREQILRAIELLNENGIHTLSTFVVGFPGETERTIDNTIALLNDFPERAGTINQYVPFKLWLAPLTPLASPEYHRKYGISGGYDRWAHSTMSSDEAEGQLHRLFLENHGPSYQYPENLPRDIPIEKLKKAFKQRDDLAKSGVCSIDATNASHIAEAFRPLLL